VPFEIFLPEYRRAEAKGIWLDRLLVDDLDDAAAKTPERIAFAGRNTASGQDIRLTYAEFSARVERIALGLMLLGVEKGHVVAFQLPNWWEFTALVYACNRIGAVANPLMPIFRERELRYMLGFAEAKVAIVPANWRGHDHAAMLAGLRPDLAHLRHVLVVGGTGPASFEQALLGQAPSTTARQAIAARRPSPDDLALIMYTSGTTGEPKGAMHTSNTLLASATSMMRDIPLSSRDIVLMGSPYAHLTGFLYGLMIPMRLGTTAVALDIWSAAAAADLVEREGATFTMGATPFLSDFVNIAPELRNRLATLRTMVCGGAPIPRVLVQRAKAELAMDVLAIWGMTENGAVTMTRRSDPEDLVFGSDGRALPGMQTRVVDDERRPVPHGTPGDLQARGVQQFAGYLKKPHLNAIDPEGWFDTGDLARQDADGYIRIVGRTKDVIIRGGENIPVAEVEDLVYRHPKVAECAVVAMPDDRLGERGCVFVITRGGVPLELPELCQFLGDSGMAKPYWPERLVVLTEMPRTPSGKIQKFKLREIAASVVGGIANASS
jgi:cyclohexanecarboxylate-CoA ligase